MTAEPLERVFSSIRFTDAELRRILRVVAADSAGMLVDLEGKSEIRAAQIRLAQAQVDAWGDIHGAVRIGIGDAVYGEVRAQAIADQLLASRAGQALPDYWKQSAIQQAKQGIFNIQSRKQNGITLSQRVYKGQAYSKGLVEDAVNSGLALGKSAREIAQSVKGLINPSTPGGVSYAAMRLGRTEVNNAQHTTSINKYKSTPWIEYVAWNLSGSHPRPDLCNEYAESVHVPGQPEGVFYPEDVPGKPHPNCFCYIEPVVMDLDSYARDFKAGKFDDYIDKQMSVARPSYTAGEARSALRAASDAAPNLSTAAQRKAAAQGLGIDYAEFARLMRAGSS